MVMDSQKECHFRSIIFLKTNFSANLKMFSFTNITQEKSLFKIKYPAEIQDAFVDLSYMHKASAQNDICLISTVTVLKSM